MTPSLASTAPRLPVTGTPMNRARGLFALVTIVPLMLLGCAAEDSSPPAESSAPSPTATAETDEPQEASSPESEPDETQEIESDAPGEISDGTGPGNDLPDPDEMDLERTDELGAYFSEEEACMSIGSMVEGLQADMNAGIEEQNVLDEVYQAVEQTYIYAPVELRDPLESILSLLDTDVDSLEEEDVLVAAEPVDGWLTVEFCDGQYHNQNHSDDA